MWVPRGTFCHRWISHLKILQLEENEPPHLSRLWAQRRRCCWDRKRECPHSCRSPPHWQSSPICHLLDCDKYRYCGKCISFLGRSTSDNHSGSSHIHLHHLALDHDNMFFPLKNNELAKRGLFRAWCGFNHKTMNTTHVLFSYLVVTLRHMTCNENRDEKVCQWSMKMLFIPPPGKVPFSLWHGFS